MYMYMYANNNATKTIIVVSFSTTKVIIFNCKNNNFKHFNAIYMYNVVSSQLIR